MNRIKIKTMLAVIAGDEERRREVLRERFGDEASNILRAGVRNMTIMGFVMSLLVAFLMGSSTAKTPIIPIGSAAILIVLCGGATVYFVVKEMRLAAAELVDQTAESLFSQREALHSVEQHLHATLGMRQIYRLYYGAFRGLGVQPVIDWYNDPQHDAAFLDWMAWHVLSPDSNLVDWVIAQRTRGVWGGELNGFLDDFDSMLHQISPDSINRTAWEVLGNLGMYYREGVAWDHSRDEAIERLSDHLRWYFDAQNATLQLNVYVPGTVPVDLEPS